MRWSLRLSEFDFIVEHKPGNKIKHVDALSRQVAAVVGDGPPARTKSLLNKEKTPFVTHENREPTLARVNIFWTTTESYLKAGPIISIS